MFLRGLKTIKNNPTHIYTHTHAFLLHTHFFLFDKLYIYTYLTKKKKSLLFLIKIMFVGNISQNKIYFYHFHSEILKQFHFHSEFLNFILK